MHACSVSHAVACAPLLCIFRTLDGKLPGPGKPHVPVLHRHLAPHSVPHPAMAGLSRCQVLDLSDLPETVAEPVASPIQQPVRSRKRKGGGRAAPVARPPRRLKPVPPSVKTGAELTEALRALAFATGTLIPVFLELFCGSKHLSQGMQEHGLPSLGIDILDGYDLCDSSMQAAVSSAIAAGWVISVWMGLPCNSWSKARRGRTWEERNKRQYQGRRHHGFPAALRDRANLWGLPRDSLSPCDRQTLQRHNTLVIFALEVIDQCTKAQLPVAVENPSSSMLWSLPELQSRIHDSLQHVTTVTTDYCCWGTPWRKRTTMIFWFWPAAVASISRVCRASRGTKGQPAICSISHKPHMHLSGMDPKTKTFITKQADPYPRKMVEALVAASGLSKAHRPVHGR